MMTSTKATSEAEVSQPTESMEVMNAQVLAKSGSNTDVQTLLSMGLLAAVGLSLLSPEASLPEAGADHIR